MWKVYIDRTGESFVGENRQKAIIIECFNNTNCTVQFEDGTIIYKITYACLGKGSFANPNYPNIEGKGFIGIGKYKPSVDGKHTKEYGAYSRMLARCYSKDSLKRNPCYKKVTVCEEWLCFQNFAEWHEQNWKLEYMDRSWHLDKDILSIEHKIYSPETCAYIPQEINVLLVHKNNRSSNLPLGVSKSGNKFSCRLKIKNVDKYLGTYSTAEEAFQAYKKAKESYIREKADEWKGKIDSRIYEALHKYKVKDLLPKINN